jgi:hypothetical protein
MQPTTQCTLPTVAPTERCRRHMPLLVALMLVRLHGLARPPASRLWLRAPVSCASKFATMSQSRVPGADSARPGGELQARAGTRRPAVPTCTPARRSISCISCGASAALQRMLAGLGVAREVQVSCTKQCRGWCRMRRVKICAMPACVSVSSAEMAHALSTVRP